MRRLVVIPGGRLKSVAVIFVLGVMGALVLSVFWQGSAVVLNYAKDRHVVMLDPGHGGYDPGAITKQGVYEKDINLKMANKIRDFLKPSGIEVIQSRDEDEDFAPDRGTGKTTKKQIDLNYRIAIAQQSKADIFVSIHVNAATTSQKSGAETFYHFSSDSGKRLAETIQSELIKIPGMNRRVAKPADFYIMRNTAMPAVVIELGYLSNATERSKLQQSWYQDQLAKGIAKGIAQYFGLP
ncbi:MAG: N-acetylmuramoyl-L-alanine amidase family protein [Desulfitobacteriaceae bacterium]